MSHTIPAAGYALNDIIEMGVVPAGCRVVDMTLDSDDLDSNGTPLITLDVGIMSGTWQDNDAARTCGDEFFDGSTAGQTGVVARMSEATGFQLAKSNTERSIGLKIAAAAATDAGGVVRLTVLLASE